MSAGRGLLCMAALALLASTARGEMAIDIAVGGAALFHHLEASGRHALAVPGETVALA